MNAEVKDHEQSANSSIAVQKRVDGFELDMYPFGHSRSVLS